MTPLPTAVERYLTHERVCRVGSSSADGVHLAPVWFLWSDGEVWLHMLTRSRRWRHFEEDPRVAVLMDTGNSVQDYRGVEFGGTIELHASPPRDVAERYHRKYRDPSAEAPDAIEGHAWARVTPTRVRHWGWGVAPTRPPAYEPEDLSRYIIPRMNAGDIDGILALYEDDALLVRPDGSIARGTEEIRASYAWILERPLDLVAGVPRQTLRFGELALTATGKHAGGVTVEIARRQRDGSWLWVIDHPNFA